MPNKAITMLKLVIGNKNYSSWSLRAWLFLRQSDIPFQEIRIPMFTDTWKEQVARYSPAGRVPVLLDSDFAVWDSTAIIQYVQEKFPDAVGWPTRSKARARARSISAEMHSGFLAVRDELPQNIRARHPLKIQALSKRAQAQTARIISIWEDCRETFAQDGPWLFGNFSVADVMYTPVALRFVTYGIPLSDVAARYVETVENLPTVKEWIAAAEAEVESIDFVDRLVPASDSPLTLG